MTGETDLSGYIAVLEDAITRAKPMSQRARVLTSLQRFAERAQRTFDVRNQPTVPGFRLVAGMLEVRDMVRQEQAWIDSLLRDEEFSRDHEDLLLAYKMMLAVVESTTIISVGYIGSEKEDSDEAGWWGRRAGAVLMQTLALVPSLNELPEDREP